MDPELWPQQPHPEPAGPHFDCEISQLAELRTVRHGLRTWLPGIYEDSDTGASVLEHVLMVVDELISNGLRHGGAPVHVHAVGPRRGCCSTSATATRSTAPSPLSTATLHSAAWDCASWPI